MKHAIDDFIQQFSKNLPPELHAIKDEFEQALRQGFTSLFQKMNLVSRQEFDIQTQVLAKTRAKLEKLEHSISILENDLR